MADDDFFDDEAADFGEPVHPDDRLWRHPSELNKVPPPGARSIPDTVDFAPVPAQRKGWPALAASGVVGAAVAVTVIMMTGLGERVATEEDASVTTRPLGFVSTTEPTTTTVATTTTPTPTTTAPARSEPPPPPDYSQAAAAASPSMVWITVVSEHGTTDCAGLVVRSDGHVVTDAQPFANLLAPDALSPDALSPDTMSPGALSPDASSPEHPSPDAMLPEHLSPQITVRFHDGTAAIGVLVGIDPITELAVVKVDRTDLIPAPVGDPRGLQPGAPVLLLAPDQTGQPAARSAMINAVGTPARVDDRTTLYDMIQFDLAVPSAISGGPLLDPDGKVVGVTVRANNGQPYGLATPIDSVSAVAADLIEQGHARHAWLGVEVTQDGADPTVIAVVDGAPAQVAGLLAGDVIVAVDGAPIPSTAALVTQIRNHRPGDEITVTYRRHGVNLDCVVLLAER